MENFNSAVHIRNPDPNASQITDIEAIKLALTSSKDSNELYLNHLDWINDKQIFRFLTARNFDRNAALDLSIEALKWREHRQPSRVHLMPNWEEKMKKENETGKIYIPGLDKWHRPILVFDNTVQNNNSVDAQMLFLGWYLELAAKFMNDNADKYLVFIHLEHFSIFNAPPFSACRETINILSNFYAERLGHCIVYKPSIIFTSFFNAIKHFLDPITVAKIIFITGDVIENGENDLLMKHVIGDDWKIKTGVEQPTFKRGSTPGFHFESYWANLLKKIQSFEEAKLITFE
jgi:hypothetical protein